MFWVFQLNLKKTEGPSTTIVFLGIELDSSRIEARLPGDKVEKIKVAVHTAKRRKKDDAQGNPVSNRSA
jgi:hypothetical protein